MSYCIYLRKSRADAELEKLGQGETLARHRRTLTELAERQGYEIGKVYEEIVSGETLAARPQMQQLLVDVEQGKWQGVLVMELERLARGNSIDQGIVMQAFTLTGTLIITPAKVYDPQQEFDEEYLEFGLFMSRREYKTINRRLQAGRIASVKEGNYIGS
ncbi:MAG: recombinase family protein, partial [Ruminococcus sp.]|nr:recombinase family protein [Ruminococcus sp.]